MKLLLAFALVVGSQLAAAKVEPAALFMATYQGCLLGIFLANVGQDNKVAAHIFDRQAIACQKLVEERHGAPTPELRGSLAALTATFKADVVR